MSSREKLFLIGYMNHQIIGSKLPSRGDCLKVLFFNMRITKLNLNDSASLVIEECIVFWKKARIPTQVPHRFKDKLKKLYEEWKGILKNKNKTNQTLKQKEQLFGDSMNDLFDIAHQDALNMISIQEDKLFLVKQREKGRPGSMLGVDIKLTNIEKQKETRKKTK
uniref:Uncharacterized protein n=1 Tax=Schizaphis graminum TaxID=13262 RepID=A0A2S2PN24_SCHGA